MLRPCQSKLTPTHNLNCRQVAGKQTFSGSQSAHGRCQPTSHGRCTSELSPIYGADCPVVVVFRASWPDERILRGTLSTIGGIVESSGVDRNALILVGRSLSVPTLGESYLYSSGRDRTDGTEG